MLQREGEIDQRGLIKMYLSVQDSMDPYPERSAFVHNSEFYETSWDRELSEVGTQLASGFGLSVSERLIFNTCFQRAIVAKSPSMMVNRVDDGVIEQIITDQIITFGRESYAEHLARFKLLQESASMLGSELSSIPFRPQHLDGLISRYYGLLNEPSSRAGKIDFLDPNCALPLDYARTEEVSDLELALADLDDEDNDFEDFIDLYHIALRRSKHLVLDKKLKTSEYGSEVDDFANDLSDLIFGERPDDEEVESIERVVFTRRFVAETFGCLIGAINDKDSSKTDSRIFLLESLRRSLLAESVLTTKIILESATEGLGIDINKLVEFFNHIHVEAGKLAQIFFQDELELDQFCRLVNKFGSELPYRKEGIILKGTS